jgi:hypothetical protein
MSPEAEARATTYIGEAAMRLFRDGQNITPHTLGRWLRERRAFAKTMQDTEMENSLLLALTLLQQHADHS